MELNGTFFEKKKIEPKFKKAVAVRTILKPKTDLVIDEENISLMMGNNCHVVIYPINKNKELNVVCIIREKKYDPDNIKSLVGKVIAQNSDLEKVFEGDLKNLAFIFYPLKYFRPQIVKFFILEML